MNHFMLWFIPVTQPDAQDFGAGYVCVHCLFLSSSLLIMHAQVTSQIPADQRASTQLKEGTKPVPSHIPNLSNLTIC